MSKKKKSKQNQKRRKKIDLAAQKAKMARDNARGKKITKASPQPPKGTKISKSARLTLLLAKEDKRDTNKSRAKRSKDKAKSLAKKRSHDRKMAKRMLLPAL